jgi:hypothetical protein
VAVERRVGGPEAAWQRLGETADWEWEDAQAPPETALEYRLADASGAQRALAGLTTPAAPTPAVARDLTARPRGTAVRLSWTGGDLSVAQFSVERSESPEGPWAMVPGAEKLVPAGLVPNTFVDRPRGGEMVYYRVKSASTDGKQTSLSNSASVRRLTAVPQPLLDFDFETPDVTGPTGPAEFTGPHRVEDLEGRGVLRTEGGFAVPYGPALAVKDAFTIAIRFRPTAETPMPVLVSQGAWEGPGYFLQLYFGKLRFYAGGAGYLDTPVDWRLGEWHTAVCVYDGQTLANFWDGKLAGEQPATGAFQPADAHFTVARYTEVGPDWALKGDVDFVRLYDRPLEPWMVLGSAPGKGAAVDLDWSSPTVTVAGKTALWHQEPRLVDTPQGRAAAMNGGLTIPYSDLLTIGESLTLETRFLLRSLDGMPVLIGQGLWPDEGYLLQVLGKRLRFHIGGVGSLDCGPELETNRWYAVKCTYDGAKLRVWLDGKQVGELASSAIMNPSCRPLRIGHYELDQAEYVVQGLMGRTRITGTVEQ